MIESILFYFFSLNIVLGSLMVVSSRNAVNSVLCLIYAFFNAAGLILLIGAEFIAMMLIIVYVGAIAVLFLFVVMMLNINNLKANFTSKVSYLKYIAFSIIIIVDLIIAVQLSIDYLYKPSLMKADYPITYNTAKSNVHAIGEIMYQNYGLNIQVAGLILFVAMIGCIVVTLDDNKKAKRQSIANQLRRKASDAIKLVNVKQGGGIDE